MADTRVIQAKHEEGYSPYTNELDGTMQGTHYSLLSSEGMQRSLGHDDRPVTFVGGDPNYERILSQPRFLSPRASRLLCGDDRADNVS